MNWDIIYAMRKKMLPTPIRQLINGFLTYITQKNKLTYFLPNSSPQYI